MSKENLKDEILSQVLKDRIFMEGTTEILRFAYEFEKENFQRSQRTKTIEECNYYGKRMDILHKAWIALEILDDEIYSIEKENQKDSEFSMNETKFSGYDEERINEEKMKKELSI